MNAKRKEPEAQLSYSQRLALDGLEMARQYVLAGGPIIKITPYGKKARQEAMEYLRAMKAQEEAQGPSEDNSELREAVLSKLKPYKGVSQGKVRFAAPQFEAEEVDEAIDAMIVAGELRRTRTGMLWRNA